MEKLIINLENCHGIKKLKTEFDFKNHRVVSIYAPNGAMKSSFAKVFDDVKAGRESRDKYFPHRQSIVEIIDENKKPLSPNEIYVIRPYDASLEHPDDASMLLVNNDLRKEFAKLTKEYKTEKTRFLKSLKEISKSKKDIEEEISLVFKRKEDQFESALNCLKNEVADLKDPVFASVDYDEIFSDEVKSFLSQEDVRGEIVNYIEIYNRLLDKSVYFKKGVFNYYNAETIAKNLESNGFFDAEGIIKLKDRIISNQKELEELIEEEKSSILSNPELKTKWSAVFEKLNKNKSLREFEAYLGANEALLPHLANLDDFKKKVWKSYLKAKEEMYLSFLGHFERVEKRMGEIKEEAKKQSNQWEEVISIFNRRFLHIPFRLEVINKIPVSLGTDKSLQLGFVFKDGEDEVSVKKDDLLGGLSTGEQKALYILNIIFEIETRRQSGRKTLFIVDDIADSFDYKNKYAIIEYLKDISDTPHFFQIILTHNFDFYRTLLSRGVSNYKQCRMTFKNTKEVKLEQARGINNIFVKDWKGNFFNDPKKRIASIPFIRNIIEYTKDVFHKEGGIGDLRSTPEINQLKSRISGCKKATSGGFYGTQKIHGRSDYPYLEKARGWHFNSGVMP